MARYDDEKKGALFPTRFGTATGGANERKMLDRIGGSDGFRTEIRYGADGSKTIMRTHNGMPRFFSEEEGARVPGTALPQDRGFCYRSYWYIDPDFGSQAKSYRIDLKASYSGYQWTEIKEASLYSPTGYYVTGYHFSNSRPLSPKTAHHFDVFALSGGKLYRNGVVFSESAAGASGNPIPLPSINPDSKATLPHLVGVSNGAVSVVDLDESTVLDAYSTNDFINALPASWRGLGSSYSAHDVILGGEESKVYGCFFGCFEGVTQRKNYLIDFVAAKYPPYLSVSERQYQFTNNAVLVDYHANPSIGGDEGEGWRDAPEDIPKTYEATVTLVFDYFGHEYIDGVLYAESTIIEGDIILARTDFDTGGWWYLSTYDNSKSINDSVPCCVIGGTQGTLQRTATATVSYQRLHSYNFDVWCVWTGMEQPPNSTYAGRQYWPFKDGVMQQVAGGQNTRATNTATTDYDYTIPEFGITLASGSFSIDYNKRWEAFWYKEKCDTATAFSHWVGNYYPPSRYWYNGDVFFADAVPIGGGDIDRLTSSRTDTASAIVRDYIYFDHANVVSIYVEYRGQYNGALSSSQTSIVSDNKIYIVVEAFGEKHEILLLESTDTVTPSGLEMDFPFNVQEKPTYSPIPNIPCVFAPITNQGDFPYIAYTTGSEQLNEDPDLESPERFLLSLPIVLTRSGDMVSVSPEYPALVYIPYNIENIVGRFGTGVLTSGGTHVFLVHVSQNQNRDWLVDLSTPADDHYAYAWRY